MNAETIITQRSKQTGDNDATKHRKISQGELALSKAESYMHAEESSSIAPGDQKCACVHACLHD